jgi:hypothetical protein
MISTEFFFNTKAFLCSRRALRKMLNRKQTSIMILYGLNTNYNQTVFEYQRQKPPNRRKNLIIAHVSLKKIIKKIVHHIHFVQV